MGVDVPGQMVGLTTDTLTDTGTAILAVLRTGAAFLPLDLTLPAERLAYTVEKAGRRLAIGGGEIPGCAAVPPAGATASAGPEWVHTTGFWQVPRLSEWEPPKRLTRFLQDGEKPVAIGFSSHVGVNPEANGEIVLEAVRELGIRAIVVAGWGGIAIKDPPQNMLIETKIPYDWLFPRVRAVVHTGGCGTHNAALVAGAPHATVPVHREGLMWSNHLHDLGLAPEPIMMRDLTAGKLTAAIREAVENRQYAVNAAALGEKIAAITFGAMAFSSEYQSGGIRVSLCAVPNRTLWYLSKAAVVGGPPSSSAWSPASPRW